MNDTAKKNQKTVADVVKADFVETLKEMNKGQTVFDLSAALDEVVASVKATRKPAKLVYTMIISPVPKTENQVGVHDDIDKKLPKPDRFQSLFFMSKDNRLTREDPEQGSFKGI